MKKPDLRAALKPQPARSAEVVAPNGVEASEAEEQRPAKRGQNSSRAGKVMIAGYFAPEVSKQLNILAITEDTTVQRLIAEALNDLFDKRNLPAIAMTEAGA